MAKTYKVSTVEVSAQSRKEWLARRRSKGEVATSAAAVVVQSEASSAPSALDALFRQVNIGTDDAPKYVAEALFPLRIGDALLDWHADQKYLGVEHASESEKANFFATGGVTAGGIGSSSGGGTGGGGSSTLSGLNDVALKSPISSDVLVYNGTHWVNTPMSTIKPDLTAYATKTWVEDKGYALNSALLKVDDRLANVETIFTADQDGAINKWSEVVAFLDGIEGDTLDNILSQFATQKWVEGNYLPIDGTAKNAEKLGGEEPDHYATAAALSTLSKAVTEFRSLFDSFFEKDTANNAIKAKLSLYSLGGITAGGIGSGGSSSGGGASYDRLDAWADYSQSKAGYVLSALLGKDLDTRVSALANAGYITASALDPYAKSSDVADTYATQTALQGVDIRVQAIEYIFEKDQDGVINKWQEIVDFLAGVEGTTLDSILDQFATKDSLAGYLPLSGGTLSGLLTIPADSLVIRGVEGNGVADRIVNQGYSKGLWGTKDAPEQGLWSIRNAFAFDWYNDRWIIGAIRYGDATSAGFGVGLIDTKDDGTIYQKNLFRIDKNGEIYQNGVALANKYLGINAIANLAYGVPAVQNHEGLGAATYGNYGGFVQSAMGGPSEGTWYSRLKVLHGNSKGYYQEIAMPFFSDDLYYRRMSEGVLSDWVKIPSENSVKSIVRGIDTALIPYTDGVVPSGWHRVAVTTRGFNHANNIRLKVARMWNNNPSEAFVVDISACYGKVVFSQVSGCAYNRLIDKIRVVGAGDVVAYVDVHFKSANTNVCTVSVRGTANIHSTIEYLGDTDVDNQYVFSIIDGAAFSDAVTAPTFIGNLKNENYITLNFKNEEHSIGVASSANPYLPSGTSLNISPTDINPASSNLVVLSCRNGTSGTNNAYFGAVNSGEINNASHFVIGRRTGVQSWAESLRVDKTGKVGIGTTSPTSKLHVVGGARITDNTTIEKNLWVDKNIYLAESESDGAIYFGDDEYAYIKETPDDVMTIASNQGLILRVNHISDEGAVIKLDGPVRIGDAILSWDATNKCVTIKNANTGEKASLFVDGGVTGTKIN